MRSLQELRRIHALVALGLNDCAIARLTGVPRTTVRDWRRAERWAQQPQRCGTLDSDSCALCYLVHHHRGVYRLTVTLDAKYPSIVSECREAIEAVMPRGRVGIQFRFGGTCAWVSNSSKQWPCLLPQHGQGKKHERRIELAPWQQKVIDVHGKPFLRGLIHSDGCRSTNTVRHGSRTYAYPRYTFSNRSDDIRQIFCDTCDLLGVEWRVMNAWNISVARRASVALLDEFIGPKT